MREFPFCLAGKLSRSDRPLDVINPYDRSTVGRTWLAGDADFEQAADAAVAAARRMRELATFERAEILTRMSALVAQHRDEVAETVAGEVGKPIRDARTETDRSTHYRADRQAGRTRE